MNESFDALADRLDLVAEEIAEAALSDLKDAVRRGDQKRSGTERTLTQARRAVDKAAYLLRTLRADEDAPDGSDQLD